jgi:hypothetical protein
MPHITNIFSRISPRPAVALTVLLALSACASTPPPTAELAVSTAAVERASSAGAATAAPTELKAAQDKLARANAAMAVKDFEQARVLVHEAQVDAQLAEARTQSAKARKAADQLQEDSRVLREELDRKNNTK